MESERGGERATGAGTSMADQQVERERERDVCVFFLNFVSLFFFYSGNSSTYFKVLCRSFQKKSDRT